MNRYAKSIALAGAALGAVSVQTAPVSASTLQSSETPNPSQWRIEFDAVGPPECGTPRGPQVKAWQAILWAGGYLEAHQIDGIWGQNTGVATIEWKVDHGNVDHSWCVLGAGWNIAQNGGHGTAKHMTAVGFNGWFDRSWKYVDGVKGRAVNFKNYEGYCGWDMQDPRTGAWIEIEPICDDVIEPLD